MSKTIENYISELRSTTNAAGLNHGVWWVYKSSDTRPKYLDTMNDYVSFFHTSIHAHFVALVVALYAIYETRKDTVNIPGLMKLLRKEGSLESEEMDSLKAMWVSTRPLWVKVGILRNEVFAHRNNDQAVADAFEKAKISPDELWSLIEKTQDILNAVTNARSGEVHAFNRTSREDTLRLLEALKRAGGG